MMMCWGRLGSLVGGNSGRFSFTPYHPLCLGHSLCWGPLQVRQVQIKYIHIYLYKYNLLLKMYLVLESGDFHCIDKECQHNWMPERTSFQCSHNGSAAVWNNPENKTTGTTDFLKCPLEFSDVQIPCEEAKSVWLYDSFEMSQTGVTEWDLVCDRLWVIGMVSSLYMVGLMIGSFIV